MPAFSLPALDGKTYTNEDFKDVKNLGVVFLSNHCRISQKFQKALIEIKKKTKGSENDFFVISPNHPQSILPHEEAYSDLGDSFEEMNKRAIGEKYNFTFLFDGEHQSVTEAFGASITPSAYVFGPSRTQIYAGRIGNHEKVADIEALEFYQYLFYGEEWEDTRITRSFGSVIKWKSRKALLEKTIRNYSKETVFVRMVDGKTLRFLTTKGVGRLKIYFAWSIDDKNCVDNLQKISHISKIYRKRGVSVGTIHVGTEEEKDDVEEILSRAQISGINYMINGNEFNILNIGYKSSTDRITPSSLILSQEGKPVEEIKGDVNIYDLRKKLLMNLINVSYKNGRKAKYR